VSVKTGPPAVAELGFKFVIAGRGLIVNCALLEVRPPEVAVIATVPGLAIKAAETVAVNWLAPTTVVGRAVPFHCTVAPVAKPEPFTVTVNAGAPATTEFGLSEVIAGAAATANGSPSVVMPAETTVTVAAPAVAIKLAGTVAVSWLALTKVVVRAVAFQRTTAPETKPAPFTVRVKAGPPAVAEFGLREVIAGAGAIVKGDPLVVIPAENTVTVAVPAVAIRVAEIGAVSWLALTKPVVRGVPFQRTTASDAKPLPLTVSVNAAAPAVAELGFREVMAG
jgi:hypothetical protein